MKHGTIKLKIEQDGNKWFSGLFMSSINIELHSIFQMNISNYCLIIQVLFILFMLQNQKNHGVIIIYIPVS